MQLDAEDDENPFYKPPVVPLPSEQAESGRLSGETEVETATATADQEE